VAFGPDGTLAVGREGGVVLCDVNPRSWQRRACRIANRDLTREEWDQYVGPSFPYRSLCAEVLRGEGETVAPDPAKADGP
jgi:hypothetical protein